MIFLPNFEEKKFARKILGNPVIHKIVCDINIQVPLTSLVIMKVNVISFFLLSSVVWTATYVKLQSLKEV